MLSQFIEGVIEIDQHDHARLGGHLALIRFGNFANLNPLLHILHIGGAPFKARLLRLLATMWKSGHAEFHGEVQ